MFSRTRIAGLAVLAMLLTASLLWAAEGSTLKVTVSYEGDGEVSATHPILVGVSDTPYPASAGSSIRASQTRVIKNNDDTVTFENLSWSPVYVTALYLDKGFTFPVQVPRGEVPVGTGDFSEAPMGTYGAIEISDGQTVEVDLQFDDSVRGPVLP